MYGLNPTEARSQLETLAATPYDPIRDSAPGFFSGTGTASVEGLGAAFTGADNLFNEALTPIAQEFTAPLDEAFGTKTSDWWDKNILKSGQDMMKSLQPNPQTTGWLGNALYGIAKVAPKAAAGFAAGGPAGAAALVGTTEGNDAKDQALNEGRDETTALGEGVISGATQAVGVLMPGGVGGTLAKRIASGSAMNVGLGVAQRGATSAWLSANSYDAMAAQYRPMDGASIFADAVLGGGFGAMHEGAAHDPLPSQVDAALAANNIHNIELDSAPGIPTDLATRNSHVDAMNLATEQMMRGDPVNVASVMKDSNFLMRGQDETAPVDYRSALEENGFGDLLKASDKVDGYNQRIGEMADTVRTLQESIDNSDTDIGKWNLVDPATAERLQSIQDELDTPGLNRKRRLALEDQRNMVIDGANIDDEVKAALRETENQKLSASIVTDKLQKRLVAAQRDFRREVRSMPDEMRQKYSDLINRMEPVEKSTSPLSAEQTAINPDNIKTDAFAENEAAPNQKGEDVASAKTPELRMAQSIVDEKPDLTIAAEDETPIKAADALKEVQDQEAQAKKDSSLFDVAINCFLRYAA